MMQVENNKKIYLTEQQINYIKENQGKLLTEGSRDNLLLPYLNILQQRGQQISLSELKNTLMRKFVTEANIHALSLGSNFYLAGVARYYFNGDLTTNKRLNIFYPKLTDNFIPEICNRLDEVIVYLRNAYIDNRGMSFEQPEDFGELSIAKLFKKYGGKIDKLKTKLNKQHEPPIEPMSPAIGKNYTFNIMYSYEDCQQYNQATTPGAWCITYGQQHYNWYTKNGKCHFIIFAKNGFENIKREVGDRFPLDEYGLSLLAVRQSNTDGSFVGCTTRWNHGGYGGAPNVPNADNALTYEQLKQVTGLNDEQFKGIFSQWKSTVKAQDNTKMSRVELNAEKLSAVRKFKYIEILIRNGATLQQLYDNKLFTRCALLYPKIENVTPEKIKPGKVIIGVGTVGEKAGVDNDENNVYYTIIDRGVAMTDEVLIKNGNIALPGYYRWDSGFDDSENIPNTFAICRGDKHAYLLYDMIHHKAINVDGFKYFTEINDISDTTMCVLSNKTQHAALIYDFASCKPVDIGGRYIYENIIIPGFSFNKSLNIYICVYDSAANECVYYNSELGKVSETLSENKSISHLDKFGNNDSRLMVTQLSTTGGFFLYRVYDSDKDEFVTIWNSSYFNYGKIICDGWIELEDVIYDTKTYKPLTYPDGTIAKAEHSHVWHVQKVNSGFSYGYNFLEILVKYDGNRQIYSIYDLKINKFYINEDGTPFFDYYGSGYVFVHSDNGTYRRALPATANGPYWYQKNDSVTPLNESKIHDVAARDRYSISGEKLDAYCHVIDEVLDEMSNSFETKQILTKESLDELCSDTELHDVMDSFDVQQNLNEKFWDENNRLNPRVRIRLLDIADKFYNTLETTWVKPIDVIFTGSLCNYNWSRYSDVDLHVVVDFNEVDERTHFVKDYFDSKKKSWNTEHENLKIYGFPVELYVQDKNEEHNASGVYSLYKNDWIVEPNQDNFDVDKLDKKKIASKVMKCVDKIDELEDAYNKNTDEHVVETIGIKAKKLLTKIKSLRKHGLSHGGEYSPYNILFKALRRIGYIGKLIELKAKTFDKINTIK